MLRLMLGIDTKVISFICCLRILGNSCYSFVRSDTERLQSLTNKQAQEITECKLYISELEERERLLAQNVRLGVLNDKMAV